MQCSIPSLLPKRESRFEARVRPVATMFWMSCITIVHHKELCRRHLIFHSKNRVAIVQALRWLERLSLMKAFQERLLSGFAWTKSTLTFQKTSCLIAMSAKTHRQVQMGDRRLLCALQIGSHGTKSCRWVKWCHDSWWQITTCCQKVARCNHSNITNSDQGPNLRISNRLLQSRQCPTLLKRTLSNCPNSYLAMSWNPTKW